MIRRGRRVHVAAAPIGEPRTAARRPRAGAARSCVTIPTPPTVSPEVLRRSTSLPSVRVAAALVTAALVACRPAAGPTANTDEPEASGPDDADGPALVATGPIIAEPDGPGRIRVGASTITVEHEGNEIPLPAAELEAWVGRSAEMIATYLGGFPVPSLEVTLVGRGWGGVGFGMHQDGRWITIYCGRNTDAEDLATDWVMVHEMLHAAFPDLERPHRWMQEGLSTYLEPIVRAQAGDVTEAQVWRRFMRSMHHGRPDAGDRGLDITHTWGRTYWGGALFWLVADVELRKRTNNQKSLRDALQGILREGGNGRADWSTKRVVEVADDATGTTVLSELYASMAKAPGDVDLDALYAELGVARVDGEIVFDDEAPLAHVRRAMTQRRAAAQ